MMLRRHAFGTACTAFLSLTAFASAQNQLNEGLELRFANSIAAIVENKVITVDDIRREIAPYIPGIRRESRNEQEFNEKLEGLQDEIIQGLIDRELIVKEFYKKKDGEEVRRIPSAIIDNQVAENVANDFDNDRSKFLAYLRARGLTHREYRKEIEEDIIYNYMRGQQRRSQSIVSPVKIETYYNENKDRFYQEDGAYMRMIQLNRNQGETDQQLRYRLEQLASRFRSGEKFEDLARAHSQEQRGKTRGGDWGWQKRSDLRKEFSDPLFSLNKGEITEPIIQPDHGFLLYLEDRRHAGIQPIDEVRDQIEMILLQQMSRLSQERWLERLRRNGYVKHY